ncbi:MAG: hypothetical protein M5U28_11045 [Sandaracinaceae bacterium]|nr:hypothetical protein [Sandaracinaceae bacterium]
MRPGRRADLHDRLQHSGTQSCLLDCSGWSTCRADLEACNACDDDADGTVDESFTCVRGSTGNACSTSCGTLGTYTCSSSCTAGVCRGTEACNGCDDDLDGTADDGFTCALGASRSCTTACGTSGTQSCQSDCSEWRSCRASSETCNGCDDDLNGAADDGFACVRGLVYGCTTACGTPGQRTCTGTCTLPSSCFATGEYCNYCDDNGIAELADEASLATSSSTRWLYRCSDVSRAGSATNFSCAESGGSTRIRVVTSTSQTGAAYTSLRLGYGPVEAWGRATVSLNGSSYPAEGWALAVYEGTGTILGAGGTNLGVNHARRGFSAEWRFYNGAVTTQADMLALRVLDGDGTANSPLRSAVAPTPHLDGTTSGVVTQEVRLVVHPDIPGTAMREDYVELYDEAGTLLYRQAPVSPALAPGQTVQIAVTASTGSTYFSRVDLVGGFELFFSGGLRARTNATCP